MEMAGYHGIASFSEPLCGVPPDQLCARVDEALFFCAAIDAAPAESIGDDTGEPGRYEGNQRLDQRTVEQGAQQPVGELSPIYLIAVTDVEPFSVNIDDGGSGMEFDPHCFGEERSQVKIVVPLTVDDPGSRTLDTQEGVEDGAVVRKLLNRIADEKFEEIAQDDEQVGFPLLLGEKGEQRPVIALFGAAEVGIC